MVVCKCRKATKFYCFVHKTPVCFDCICSSDHEICYVGLYSDWVNDGDYDWPPKCMVCSDSMEATDKRRAIRLTCLHTVHSDCLDKHLSSYPSHTAPAGYACPSCSAAIWPSRSQKDAATSLFTNLRSAISKSSASSVLLSSATSAPDKPPPPAFSTPPLVGSAAGTPPASDSNTAGSEPPHSGQLANSHSSEANGIQTLPSGKSEITAGPCGSSDPLPAGASSSSQKPKPPVLSSGPAVVALPRKPTSRVTGEKVAIDMSAAGSPRLDRGYDDDDDGKDRKYARRGSLYAQFVRYIGSMWAPALQGLPVALSYDSGRKEREERSEALAEELVEGRSRRRHHAGAGGRRAPWDPRRLLLALAVVSGMATMMLLYYRLLQNVLTGSGQQS